MAILAVMALLCAAALAARAAWVGARIAALAAPPRPVHADAVLPPRGAGPRIVLAGDSRISRWPMADWGDGIEIINRGIGGETTVQLAARFRSDVLALDPDVIVIEAGINDLIAATLMDAAAGDAVVRATAPRLRQLAHDGTAAGARVLLATIIPPGRPELFRLPVWREAVRDAVADVNAALRRAALPDGAMLIDLSAELAAGDDRRLPDRYRLDALHLNPAGYARLSARLAALLAEQIAARSEQRAPTP